MTVFAIYSIKGGVGKTAVATNLAWLSARDGNQTLLWDLDPQGASSFYFRIREKITGGARKLIRGENPIEESIKGTNYANLDLLPADFSIRHWEHELDHQKNPTRRLRKILKPQRDVYDNMFLDCPPGISLLAQSIFRASQILLVPLIPTTLSLRTYAQLRHFLKKEALDHLRVLPFFSMVDARKKLHVDVIRTFLKEHNVALQAYIPYLSEIEKMGIHHDVVGGYAPNSMAMRAFEALWREVKQQSLKHKSA